MKLRIYIDKEYEIDIKFEKELKSFFELYGWECEGQGKNRKTGVRDIIFSLQGTINGVEFSGDKLDENRIGSCNEPTSNKVTV